MTLRDTLLRWLPADSRAGVARRVAVVWAAALFIAVFQWLMRAQEQPKPFAHALVYSCTAIGDAYAGHST